MDISALTSAVEAALAQLTSRLPTVANGGRRPVELQEAILEHELSQAIQGVLAAQEEFAHPRMVRSLSGATGFHARFVAPMLLRQARSRESAAAAVAWLQKVLCTERASGIAVATFWGLKPEAPVALPDDVQLMPFDSLPPSRQKEALSEQNLDAWPRLATPPFAWQAPTAALIRSAIIKPYLMHAGDDFQSSDAAYYSALFADVLLCLATSGPSAIVGGRSWFQYTDPDLEAALLGSSTQLAHQEITPLVLEDRGEFDLERATTLLRDFARLNSGLKNRARTAMQRLGQACLRRGPADRALELAIALEALLVESPGEHTFKIGLRAALLTSNDLDQRRRNRAIIEAMYKIRSSLLHSGQSGDTWMVRGYGEMQTTEIVSEAVRIAALVIQRVVGFGTVPDWGSLELSSPTN